MGWDSSHETPKMRQMYRYLQKSFMRHYKRPKWLLSRPSYNVNCRKLKKIIEILLWKQILSIIGKKNNQSLTPDADREISTLRSTDNSANSVTLVSSIIRKPWVEIFGLHRRPIKDFNVFKRQYWQVQGPNMRGYILLSCYCEENGSVTFQI